MYSEIMERSPEVRDGAEATLHALLRGGYATEAGRDNVGKGILLHHRGGGPDLVLYPDGTLHPVGYAPSALQVRPLDFEQPRKRRSFGKRLLWLTKWAVGIAAVLFAVGFSLAVWIQILSEM